MHDFIEQLATFPKGEHDDDVDAFTQLLIQWTQPALSEAFMLELLSIGEDSGNDWPDIVL